MLRNLNKSASGKRILGTPNVGILASQIISETATGDSGAGLLYDEALSNGGKQLRVRVTSLPGSGSLFVYENGAFELTGAADGSYSIGYDYYVDNVLTGSDTATFSVGVSSATAAGATITGTSSLSAGSAQGQINATANGANLTATSSLLAGSASGSSVVNATASGATLIASSSIVAGLATGGAAGDAVAQGATITGIASIFGGGATGQRHATANGATLTGLSAIFAGAANDSEWPVVILLRGNQTITLRG